MENIKNEDNLSVGRSVSLSCHVDETFGDTLNRCLAQIYYESFSAKDKPMANSLALIMTEVYRLPANAIVRIAGELHKAEDIKATFRKLEKENIEQVIMRNSERKYRVKYLKAYLRTLLYNSVFEFEAMKIEDY